MMNKRIIALILTAVTLISSLSFTVFANEENTDIPFSAGLPFTDVNKNAWYAESAEFCYVNGIVKGQGNEYTFAPNAQITRASFTVMLARVMGAELDGYAKSSSFADCTIGSWYTPSVEWAVDKGYVKGSSDNLFSPDAAITREQAALILSRAYGSFISDDTSALEGYKDSGKISSWAKDAVAKMVSAGIMGSTDSREKVFSPGMTLTRAQSAKIFMTVIADVTSDCDHEFNNVNCETGRICDKCRLQFTLPGSHIYLDFDCTKDAECTACGYIREATAHDDRYVSCTEAGYCARCFAYRAALGHGKTDGVCSRCKKEVFVSDFSKVIYYLENIQPGKTIEYSYKNAQSGDEEKMTVESSAGTIPGVIVNYSYAWADGVKIEFEFVLYEIYDVGYLIFYTADGENLAAAEGTISPDMYYTYLLTGAMGSVYDSWLEEQLITYYIDHVFTLIDIELNNLCGCGMSAFGFDI